MHEMSLMKDLMGKILSVAKENNAKKVVSVSVWLGALSHMSHDHFREHYEEAAVGTIAEGAELKTELSEDVDHANAQDILLQDIEVAD